jgi:hypothetical protein
LQSKVRNFRLKQRRLQSKIWLILKFLI